MLCLLSMSRIYFLVSFFCNADILIINFWCYLFGWCSGVLMASQHFDRFNYEILHSFGRVGVPGLVSDIATE